MESLPKKPNPALARLAKLIGTWGIKGRTFDSKNDNISGRVTIEWFPGGFFMVQRGEIKSTEIKVHSLEIVGYDASTKTFPAYVYSNMSEFRSKYYWDLRGNVVKHWTKGSEYVGRFSTDDNTLSGGWRPTGGERKTPENTYDAIMTRIRK
jgi:hypothetical protein